MTRIIKWKYEGYDLKFYSTDTQLERHAEQLWTAIGARQKPNITIIDNDLRTDTIPATNRPCRTCLKNEPAFSVGTEATETPEQETVGLFHVPDLLDNTDDFPSDGTEQSF